MLSRQQVLMPEWLVDHYKALAEEYDLSFSEMVRLGLCMHIGNLLPELFPDYECDISSQELAESFRSLSRNKDNREQFHAVISKIYFEARKAVKFRAEQRTGGLDEATLRT